MPNFTIDELDFNTEDLSDDGKRRIAQIEWIDSQISQLYWAACAVLMFAIVFREKYSRILPSPRSGPTRCCIAVRGILPVGS